MGLGACTRQTAEVSHSSFSSGQPTIVGIVFVRNEDCFVERAVVNAADFCDLVLLADRRSTDATPRILKSFVSHDSGKFRFFELDHPHESHRLLQPYVGKNCWVFAVDGDEIYDADRLRSFRPRLLAGEFAKWWMILGNVVHCRNFDPLARTAEGFSAPPSRSMVKLYNFGAIESWDGYTPERLHGGTPVFRSGYHDQLKLELHKSFGWEETPLRCLHMCFLPRSSTDRHRTGVARESIIETFHGGWTGWFRRWSDRLRGRATLSPSKTERYARGQPVIVDTTPFFP